MNAMARSPRVMKMRNVSTTRDHIIANATLDIMGMERYALVSLASDHYI